MKFILIALIVALINLTFIKPESLTEWKDPATGTKFDFSGLARPVTTPWTIKQDHGMFKDIYNFNFGVNSNFKCRGRMGAVTVYTEAFGSPTNICSVIADVNNRNVRLLDANNPNKGINIEYSNGEICNAMMGNYQRKYKKANFIINCSSTQGPEVTKKIILVCL